jgi:hypothetical protein
MCAMAELELTRSRDDRRLYEVDGVGTLRLRGFFARGATAEAGAASWTFDRRGLWKRAVEGALRAVDGDRELAVLDGRGWGKRPVRITDERPGVVEPGLLLFAAFVVRGLAEDASAASSGAATA